MILYEILITIIIQSLFCLGLRVLFSEGQILHFIRKPFAHADLKPLTLFILKPIVICVICFSSVWGGAVFILLNGFQPVELIISCVSTAFILKIVNDKVD